MQLREISEESSRQEQRKKKVRSKRKGKERIRRRASFSDNLMKFVDWQESYNPMREREGHNEKEKELIKKMKKFGRYPMPDLIINATPGYDIFIDSLITAGYNSDEICELADEDPECMAPQNSNESHEEIDWKSSSDDFMDMVPMPTTKREKQEAKKKKKDGKQISKEQLVFHGFDVEQLQAYPHQYVEGQIPAVVLRDEMVDDLKRLESVIGKRI